VHRYLSRLLGERTGETPVRSGNAEIRVGEDRANILLGDLDGRIEPAPSGDPAPVEADDATWQRERERRERDGRS
jgi:hypothetical protein